MNTASPPTFRRQQARLHARLKRHHSRQLQLQLLSARQRHASPVPSYRLPLRISTPAGAWAALTLAELREMVPNAESYIRKPLPPLPTAHKTEGPFIINDHINKFILLEVAVRLHKIFKHIPHTLSGTAAIAIEDNFRLPYRVRHVSLMVPPENLRAVKCWAKACGLPEIPGLQNGFGIKASDGRVCLVKVKKSTDAFNTLDIRTVGGEFEIPILSMRSIANRIAKCYIRDMEKHIPLEVQREYCEDMRWAINCMINNDYKFREENPPNWILDRRFWLPFILSFPEMADLFKQVGLSVHMGEIVIVPWEDEKIVRHWWQIEGHPPPEREVRSTSSFDNDVNNGISAKILGIRLLQERVEQHQKKRERQKKLSEERQMANELRKVRMAAWRDQCMAYPLQPEVPDSALCLDDNVMYPWPQEMPASPVYPNSVAQYAQQETPESPGCPESVTHIQQEMPESPVLPLEDRKLQVQTDLPDQPQLPDLATPLSDLSILESFPAPPTEAQKRVEQRKYEVRAQLLRRCQPTSDLRALLKR